MIKQMQYSPLQTEKDRVSEWGSFRYAVFCCREILLYLSSPCKYGKMYKNPCKKKAGMGDEMNFRTSDILIGAVRVLSSNLSMKKAWEMMKILNVVTLPVVNKKDKLEGLIVTGDIAKSYMDVYDNSILAKARTQYRNIIETLDGKIVAGNEHGYFVKGKVIVGAGTPDTIKGNVAEDDLVIISDREESQLICIEANCSCIIVTSGFDISKDVINAANAKDVVVITYAIWRTLSLPRP